MSGSGSVAAVDLGATSGRVVVGHVDRDGVHMEHVARFPNGPVSVWEGDREALHWDATALHRQLRAGLREAFTRHRDLVSIGIDSWAVDHGIVRAGRLTHEPYHYRDERNETAARSMLRRTGKAELFRRNGLQHLPFNTVFQLHADLRDGLLQPRDRVLLMPDLFGYWLTGEQVAERTNASTTGLIDVATGRWSEDLRWSLGLPPGLLPDLGSPGDEVGGLLPVIADALGAPQATPLTLVGSHDTASAVVAVPATDPHFAYISSGTWSLVGVELDAPVVTDAARAANCTNEGGVDGRVRFLKNVSGLWLLSESVRTWERTGERIDLEALLASATLSLIHI